MRQGQLLYGAEIAAALHDHEGPVTIVDMGNLVGGAYVVFSKQVRPLENQPFHHILALPWARAQVIGGQPASKVVFSGDLDRKDIPALFEAAKARAKVRSSVGNPQETWNILREEVVTSVRLRMDEILGTLETELAEIVETAENRSRLIENARMRMGLILEEFKKQAEKTTDLAQLRPLVLGALQGFIAHRFDAYHSVERAVKVKSFDEVVLPENLREAIIRHQEEMVQRYKAARESTLLTATLPGGADSGLVGLLHSLNIPFTIEGSDIRLGAGQLVRLLGSSGILTGRRGQ